MSVLVAFIKSIQYAVSSPCAIRTSSCMDSLAGGHELGDEGPDPSHVTAECYGGRSRQICGSAHGPSFLRVRVNPRTAPGLDLLTAQHSASSAPAQRRAQPKPHPCQARSPNLPLLPAPKIAAGAYKSMAARCLFLSITHHPFPHSQPATCTRFSVSLRPRNSS